MEQVVPVIQDVYEANKRLSVNDILLAIQGLWQRSIKWTDLKDNLRTRRHTLVKLLETEGFSLDEPEGPDNTALRYDAQGVEAYLSHNGGRSTRVTIAAGNGEFGIHPHYLAGLLESIKLAGFRLREVDGTRGIYTARPYDWETPHGRVMLAGTKPRY